MGLIWSVVCANKVTSIDLNKPDRYHNIDLAHEEIEVTLTKILPSNLTKAYPKHRKEDRRRFQFLLESGIQRDGHIHRSFRDHSLRGCRPARPRGVNPVPILRLVCVRDRVPDFNALRLDRHVHCSQGQLQMHLPSSVTIFFPWIKKFKNPIPNFHINKNNQ
jgi:hypothetical protein